MNFRFILFAVLFIPAFGFAQVWDNIIQDIDTMGTINLTDSTWNNTLIKNCTIHDTGSGSDGIFMRSVKNVKIENCTIYNIDGKGAIRMSISGSGTDSIQIVNNTIYNVQKNGINAPQRYQNLPGLNQNNLLIRGNTIYNTGLADNNGLHHSIYCQAADFTISNNVIFGIRDGNGISVRSSGTISGNIIGGESKANKPAIRYYSDHFTGNSDTLLIENNIAINDSTQSHVIELFEHADLYQNTIDENHIVKNFEIRFNTAISFYDNKFALRISDDYNSAGYWLSVSGNILVNTAAITNCWSVPNNVQQVSNYFSSVLSDFESPDEPYNFHITPSHGAYNFVGSDVSNFPLTDIDGEPRILGFLDAGADEFYSTTGTITVLKQNDELSVFPNPVSSGQLIDIQSHEIIDEIAILNSGGQLIQHVVYAGNSNQATFEILNPLISGMYFMMINNLRTVPIIVR